MSNFHKFKQAVARKFADISERDLYRVGVDKDALWSTYLDSFPPGTNPIYRERREYDCTCCRQFIRSIGDVVAIIEGQIVSIWDCTIDDPTYATVAKALADLVRSHSIKNLFVHNERKVGTDRTFEALTGGAVSSANSGKTATEWQHFSVMLPHKCVKPGHEIDTYLGQKRTSVEVMLRGLRTIGMDTVDIVLELIAQNSLYRGQEFQSGLIAFKNLKRRFLVQSNDPASEEIFAWAVINEPEVQAVARMRNTAIGTLLVDLADGVDLEQAVKSFERMVAPVNYKRPTALITQSMIDDAKKQIESMGLTSALERRYAQLEDVSVENVLFADRSARKKLDDDVFAHLSATTPVKAKSLAKVEEISIEKFIADVLPKAETVEVMFESRHASNLFSLIAPVDPTAGLLFKWDNGFSWSYNGDVADSIKERVKQAGGNVTGDLCCRLSWSNYDDLDLHLIEPNRNEIWFSQRQSNHGGQLDVDMNAASGQTREPVENIFYSDRLRMQEGKYQLYVHQYFKRESVDVGFDVEIDYLGDVVSFRYDKAVTDGTKVQVADFRYTHTGGFELIQSLPESHSSRSSRTIWNIGTNVFHRVNLMLLSPNHWDGQPPVGNKHYFFVLDDCKNDSTARGFFNEFLNSRLDKNRKVFEVVGSKMKVIGGADQQLSGLGFSSTQRNTLVVKVTGSFTRTVKVVF